MCCKIMRKSMILEPRGSRNRPKWCQGALRKVIVKVGREKGAASLRKSAHLGATWAILGALWPILGAIWDPAARQGAP